MNEKAKKSNPFRLIFSTIRSHNRVISILLFAIVNLVGILYTFFNIFNYEIIILYSYPSLHNQGIIDFSIIFIPISILSLSYLIHSLNKKSSWILVICILCLGIADRIYLQIGIGPVDGMVEWENFKNSFFSALFVRYYIFLVVYFIFGLIFIFFKSEDDKKILEEKAPHKK